MQKLNSAKSSSSDIFRTTRAELSFETLANVDWYSARQCELQYHYNSSDDDEVNYRRAADPAATEVEDEDEDEIAEAVESCKGIINHNHNHVNHGYGDGDSDDDHNDNDDYDHDSDGDDDGYNLIKPSISMLRSDNQKWTDKLHHDGLIVHNHDKHDVLLHNGKLSTDEQPGYGFVYNDKCKQKQHGFIYNEKSTDHNKPHHGRLKPMISAPPPGFSLHMGCMKLNYMNMHIAAPSLAAPASTKGGGGGTTVSASIIPRNFALRRKFKQHGLNDDNADEPWSPQVTCLGRVKLKHKELAKQLAGTTNSRAVAAPTATATNSMHRRRRIMPANYTGLECTIAKFGRKKGNQHGMELCSGSIAAPQNPKVADSNRSSVNLSNGLNITTELSSCRGMDSLGRASKPECSNKYCLDPSNLPLYSQMDYSKTCTRHEKEQLKFNLRNWDWALDESDQSSSSSSYEEVEANDCDHNIQVDGHIHNYSKGDPLPEYNYVPQHPLLFTNNQKRSEMHMLSKMSSTLEHSECRMATHGLGTTTSLIPSSLKVLAVKGDKARQNLKYKIWQRYVQVSRPTSFL